MLSERTRQAVHEVEAQRDDAVAYLATIRLVLEVVARNRALRQSGQEIAEILVRQLAVETCAIALDERRRGELSLVGFATQSQRLGGGPNGIGESGWLLLAQLVGAGTEPHCFRRVSDGGFVAVAPAELAGEGFLVLPFALGGEPGAALVLHSLVAPVHLFARGHALSLVADIVGQALTAARSRESVEQLCGKLEGELGLARETLTARDETLRSREERIGTLTQELMRSNRVKSDFLGMVSHELRTPLNAILGYVSLLRDGVSGPITDEQSVFLDRTLASTRHLNALIDDILFFVQMENDRVLLRRETIPTATLVEEVLESIPVRPTGVTIRVDVRPGAERLHVDADLVRRLLFHLVGNALKFTAAGEVLIRVEPSPERAAVIVTVRDTGPGIPTDRVNEVFGLFAQVDSSATRSHNGLGMGLALAARCVRLLNGHIAVRSEPGAGSEFSVTLPGSLAADPEPRPAGTWE
jgi:signal transduction histidine kinase